jgi:hypothetical protein
MELRRIGIWHSRRKGGPGVVTEIEKLGYGAFWLGGSPSVEQARPYVEAGETILVATGILNVWQHDPADVAATTTSSRATIRAASCSASASGIPRRRATTSGR